MKDQSRVINTTLRLRVPVWRLLRKLAEDDAVLHGGRPSVTAAATKLIEQSRKAGPPEAA